jgi:hypothetical protein
VIGRQDERVAGGADVLEAMDGENLAAREEGEGAQQQAVAEAQMGQRTGDDLSRRGHAPSLLAGPDGQRLGNLRGVHALRLSALDGESHHLPLTPRLIPQLRCKTMMVR